MAEVPPPPGSFAERTSSGVAPPPRPPPGPSPPPAPSQGGAKPKPSPPPQPPQPPSAKALTAAQKLRQRMATGTDAADVDLKPLTAAQKLRAKMAGNTSEPSPSAALPPPSTSLPSPPPLPPAESPPPPGEARSGAVQPQPAPPAVPAPEPSAAARPPTASPSASPTPKPPPPAVPPPDHLAGNALGASPTPKPPPPAVPPPDHLLGNVPQASAVLDPDTARKQAKKQRKKLRAASMSSAQLAARLMQKAEKKRRLAVMAPEELADAKKQKKLKKERKRAASMVALGGNGLSPVQLASLRKLAPSPPQPPSQPPPQPPQTLPPQPPPTPLAVALPPVVEPPPVASTPSSIAPTPVGPTPVVPPPAASPPVASLPAAPAPPVASPPIASPLAVPPPIVDPLPVSPAPSTRPLATVEEDEGDEWDGGPPSDPHPDDEEGAADVVAEPPPSVPVPRRSRPAPSSDPSKRKSLNVKRQPVALRVAALENPQAIAEAAPTVIAPSASAPASVVAPPPAPAPGSPAAAAALTALLAVPLDPKPPSPEPIKPFVPEPLDPTAPASLAPASVAPLAPLGGERASVDEPLLVKSPRTSRVEEIDAARERVRAERRASAQVLAPAVQSLAASPAPARQRRSSRAVRASSRAERFTAARKREMLQRARRLFEPLPPHFVHRLHGKMEDNSAEGLIRHGHFVYAAELALGGPDALREARARFLSDVYTAYEEEESAECELLLAGFALLADQGDAIGETCDALVALYDADDHGAVPETDVVEFVLGTLIFKSTLQNAEDGEHDDAKLWLRAQAQSIANTITKESTSDGQRLKPAAFRVLLISLIGGVTIEEARAHEKARHADARHAEAVRYATEARDAMTQQRFAAAHQHLASLAAGSAASAADVAANAGGRAVATALLRNAPVKDALAVGGWGPSSAATLEANERRRNKLAETARVRRREAEAKVQRERDDWYARMAQRITVNDAAIDSWSAQHAAKDLAREASDARRAVALEKERELQEASRAVAATNAYRRIGTSGGSPPALRALSRSPSGSPGRRSPPPIRPELLPAAASVPRVEWYYADGLSGVELGPVPATMMPALAESGAITATTPVWRTGWSRWEVAGAVGRLAPLLDSSVGGGAGLRADAAARGPAVSMHRAPLRRTLADEELRPSSVDTPRHIVPTPYASSPLSPPYTQRAAAPQRMHWPPPLPQQHGQRAHAVTPRFEVSASHQGALRQRSQSDRQLQHGERGQSPGEKTERQRALDNALNRFRTSPLARSVASVDVLASPPTRVPPPLPSSRAHPPASRPEWAPTDTMSRAETRQSSPMAYPPASNPEAAWTEMMSRAEMRY